MQHPIISFITGALISGVVFGGGMFFHSTKKIDLYKIRLRETLDEIHRLQHELDPTHQRFSHGDAMAAEDLAEHHDHHMDAMEHGDTHHMHNEAIDLTGGDWHPTVTLSVEQDPVSGWNVHIATTNFTFAPERASKEHVSGEGHAHLYADGEKIARVYSPWFHITDLDSGEHEIRVTLNSNTHQSLLWNGTEVRDQFILRVP